MTTPPPLKLPPLLKWPRGTIFVGPQQWDVLGQTLAQLHAEHQKVLDQIQTLSSVLTRPVSGRVSVRLKEQAMPIPVHPTDTLAFSVQYDNAAHQVVAGTVPTTWTAVATDGTPFTGATLTVAPFPADESGTAVLTVDTGSFMLHAQLQGAAFTAISDEIDISPDNTPTSGVVAVTVTPAV